MFWLPSVHSLSVLSVVSVLSMFWLPSMVMPALSCHSTLATEVDFQEMSWKALRSKYVPGCSLGLGYHVDGLVEQCCAFSVSAFRRGFVCNFRVVSELYPHAFFAGNVATELSSRARAVCRPYVAALRWRDGQSFLHMGGLETYNVSR